MSEHRNLPSRAWKTSWSRGVICSSRIKTSSSECCPIKAVDVTPFTSVVTRRTYVASSGNCFVSSGRSLWAFISPGLNIALPAPSSHCSVLRMKAMCLRVMPKRYLHAQNRDGDKIQHNKRKTEPHTCGLSAPRLLHSASSSVRLLPGGSLHSELRGT